MVSPSAKTLASALLVASLSSLTSATLNETILRSCLDLSGIPTSYPDINTTTWANETSAWQLRIQPSPAAVTYPTTSSQIASILSCANQSSTKVACLNGGHSYGAYGLGGNDDALIINMENFKSVSFDEEAGLFTYGGGSIVGEAATWLWENHGLHFPHVRANRVGLAGSSIGGGFGSTSRFLGTPMDNLESVQYMLYNGTILNCSRTENSDLFWVAQGAGSSYGVLLSLTTKTWKPEFDQVTNYTITLTDSSFETGINALLSIQDYALNECPDTLSMRWSLTAPPYTGSGFYYGDPTNFTTAISPLLERLGDTANITTSVSSFWDMENIATPGLNTTIETYPARNFYLQALTLQANKPLTYASASALYNFTTLAFNRTDITKFGFLDLWGGISRDIKDTDTSFAHADNLWLIRWEGRLATGLTEFPSDGISYMQEGFRPFQDQLAVEGIPLRGFVNYRDTELTVDEWSARLYGENFGRMQEIKASVDPTAMFTTNPQSIPLP